MKMMHFASLLLLPALCSAKAILGVDLGSLYMKVALVQRGAPLEIVTNLHAKRKTENMILFDESTRFYGADANSLYGRKPEKSPMAVSVLLGRDDEHPSVTVSGTIRKSCSPGIVCHREISRCAPFAVHQRGQSL
jgi:molecular chaperone DnaK (HSP70)